MIQTDNNLSEFHWMMELLQSIDVGLVVFNSQYQIQTWNSFMENHSGLRPSEVTNRTIFDIFTDLPEEWFRHKAETVMLLNIRSFTIWEQRPYIFRFNNYRPITGTAPHMYQNSTFIPLSSRTGQIDHFATIIYDVTDTAVNKQALKSANAKLEHLSQTDQMTGLFNRGYWEKCLVHEFKLWQRYKRPVSLLMFDIDHFKKINDTYGHQPGDEVIKATAKVLLDAKRETDIAGRYGGEEFAVILMNAAADQAAIFAERLRQSIEQMAVPTSAGDICFTISLGIAELMPHTTDYKTWIKQADSALYASKEGGRNRCHTFIDQNTAPSVDHSNPSQPEMDA